MADMFLNFKDFQHHSSDKDSTTLQHKKLGHKIVLAHKALSGKNRKAVMDFAKMADGGMAPIPDQGGQAAISDQKRQLHDVGTAASGSSGPDKPATGIGDALSKLASPWAQGGQVKPEGQTLNYKDLMQRKKQMNNEEANKHVMPKRLAEGGMANEDSEQDRVNNVNLNAKEPGYTKMAIGGPVDTYAQGLPCLNPHCRSHGKPHPNCRCFGPGGPAAENHAEGGEVGQGIKYCAYGFPHHADCEYAKGGQVSQQGDAVREAEKHQQAGNSGAAQQQMVEAKDEARGRAEEERFIKPKMQKLANGGSAGADIGSDVGGIPEVEESQATQPSEAQPMPQETPYQPYNTPQPEQAPGAMQTVSPDNSMAQADKSIGQHEDDEDQKNSYDLANGHIKPKTYQDLYNSKSTPGKIATLFGMLAGGIGSGLTHQPSAIMQMMDNTLQRDFEARKESKKNQINLWDLNYKHAQEQAATHNLDTNSAYVQEQSKDIADTRYQLQQGRAEYQNMIDRANSYPPGLKRDAALQAAAIAGQAVNQRAMTIKSQLDAKVRLQNRGQGLPDNTSILNPHPSMIKPSAPGQKGAQSAQGNAQGRLAPDDPKWGDNDTRASGDKENGQEKPTSWVENAIYGKKWDDQSGKPTTPTPPVPKSNAPPLITPNMDEYKRQAFLMNQKDEKGRPINPDIMTEDEKGRIADGLDNVSKYNMAIKEVHKQFPELWKNAGSANDAIQWLGSQHLWGTKAPDVSNWNDQSRRYWQAASAIKKAVGQSVKGGPSEALYQAIEQQLPHNKSTSPDYRRGLDNIGSTLRSGLDLPLLQGRHMIGNVPD